MHPSSLARRTLLVCASLVGLAAATTAARADVIINNASFESPAYTFGGAFAYAPTNADWSFNGQSGIARQGASGFYSTASDGEQVAFIQNGGSFRQDITLDAGSYTLSFYESQRVSGGGDGNNNFNVSLGRNLAGGNFIVPAHFAASATPTLVRYDFSLATAGTFTLSFNGLNYEDNGDHTVFIDAVSITPAATAVPTPAAALGALPLLALAAWKRRRA